MVPEVEGDVLDSNGTHYSNLHRKGALIGLEYLKLDGLKELVSVPDGMEFLSSIQDVYFRSLHPRFRQNLQESVETERLKHIPVMQFQ